MSRVMIPRRWGRGLVPAVILGLVAISGCDGDTPAAGSCIVAFHAFDDALHEEADAQTTFQTLERSLYWCEDQDEWKAGVSRIGQRPPRQPSDERRPDGLDRLDGTFAVLLDCSGDRAESPVCRDVRGSGVLTDNGEANEPEALSRKLVVMAEYEAFPVWDNQSSLSPERLPISDGLRSDLATWGDEYSRYNLDDLWPTPTYFDEWRQRGRALAVRLQQELGSEHEVSYFDWGGEDEEPTQERVG